jgi:SHC-transforming protein 1
LNGADPDYYNDLPGKIPPEAGPPPVPPLPNLHPPLTLASASTGAAAAAITSAVSRPVSSEMASRERQQTVVQRTQSDRAAGGSCRGKLCNAIRL